MPTEEQEAEAMSELGDIRTFPSPRGATHPYQAAVKMFDRDVGMYDWVYFSGPTREGVLERAQEYSNAVLAEFGQKNGEQEEK